MKKFRLLKRVMSKLLLTACVLSLGSLSFAVFSEKSVADGNQFEESVHIQDLDSKQIESEIKSKKFKVLEPTLEKKIENCRTYLKDRFVNCRCGDEGSADKEAIFEQCKPVSEKLYQKIKNFVKTSDDEGITAENFWDYIRKFMEKSKKGLITVVNRNEFENIAKSSPDIQRLYRGIRGEWFDRFLKGEISMGRCCGYGYNFYSNIGNNSYGYAIYTSAEKDRAVSFCYDQKETKKETNMSWPKCRSSESGGVAEILIDKKNAKIISVTDLENIVAVMKWLHPTDFGLVECYDKRIPDEVYNTFQFQKIFRPAFKETFGFDCAELAFRLNENYRELKDGKELDNFDSVKNKFFYRMWSGLTKEFDRKIDKLMRQNKTKAHCVNKFYTVAFEMGLMAKLLGYDAICTYVNVVDKNTNEKKFYDVDVVNPDVLVVCSERAKGTEPPVTFDDILKKDNY